MKFFLFKGSLTSREVSPDPLNDWHRDDLDISNDFGI